mgnify:CR=1 FL=1
MLPLGTGSRRGPPPSTATLFVVAIDDGAIVTVDQDPWAVRSPVSWSPDSRWIVYTRVEQANPNAANALLKTLEEPPDRTILILLAGQVADVLPTIASR